MAAFDFAKVKDPTFFKENVLNAHASFRTYASREEYRRIFACAEAGRYLEIRLRKELHQCHPRL